MVGGGVFLVMRPAEGVASRDLKQEGGGVTLPMNVGRPEETRGIGTVMELRIMGIT